MFGKLQEYKFKRYFEVYDKDRDGFFTKDEFVREAYALAEIRGRDMSDPRSQRHLADQETWWQTFRQGADTNSDDRVSLDEWLGFWSAYAGAIADEAIAGGHTMLDMLKESVKMTYASLDADGDERVTLSEFQQWATAIGIEGDSAAIFARLDANGDGVMTLPEATQMVKEFVLSNDPEAPGNHFFGTLY